MKIKILDRVCDDWHEIYANGELIFEGELTAEILLQRILDWLGRQKEIKVEFKAYHPPYEYDGKGDYEPPLHTMTGENYWSDWEKADA